VAALCATYTLLVAQGVRVALRARDDFGTYMAFGLSTMFGVQALVNLSVALAILPTKGLTLPFVSYGGSSLIVNALAAGLLLNISRQVVVPPSRAALTPLEQSDGTSPASPGRGQHLDGTSPASPVPEQAEVPS
jgi:cell division protein FtsW